MRLIDADKMKENCRITGELMNHFECVSLATLGEVIDAQPTIDPVKHGKWIESDIPNEGYCCSECGGACWCYDYGGSVTKSRYCPNCGARMERGADNGEIHKL